MVLLYRSSNGDCWRLISDAASGRTFVRHEPNVASGGRITETDVEEFLEIGGSGPEFVALRRLQRGKRDIPLGEASAG